VPATAPAGRRAFVPVDDDVAGGAAGRHDVEISIAVKIGHPKVLARDSVVVENADLLPTRAGGIGGRVESDPHDGGGTHGVAAPTRDDLVGPAAEEVAGGEAVTLHEDASSTTRASSGLPE